MFIQLWMYFDHTITISGCLFVFHPLQLFRSFYFIFIIIYRQKLEENWNDAKKMLGNSQLLSMLKNFPKDDLSDKQVKKVNKYFNEDLTLEKMQATSKAGYGLLTWVVAIVKVSSSTFSYTCIYIHLKASNN